MNNNVNYTLNFNVTGDKNVTTVFAGINDSFNKIQGALKSLDINAFIQRIEMFSNSFSSLSAPGLAFNSSVHELNAMTDLTGKQLQEIEGYARDAAKTFGGSAAQGVESYKLILSQLSPELAKTPKALQSMGESVARVSKLMGGDQTAATQVLTTAMNQYNVSLDDPITASNEMARMMNVMGAAAKEGSAEFPQIKEALENAGMAAKSANVSFEETNAAIQVLDKAGKKGAEGGIALRNVIGTLNKGRFLPDDVLEELQGAGVSVDALTDKNLSLSDRLSLLKPLLNDTALMSKMFGVENYNAALALVGQTDEMNRLTDAVTGTNTVIDQSNIIMESSAEKNARLQARVDDFKVSLFNASGGLMGYASVLGNTVRDVSGFIPIVSALASRQIYLDTWNKIVSVSTWAWNGAVKAVAIATGGWNAIQAALNTTMLANPVFWIIAGVIALIAVIAYLIYKIDGWGQMWQHTVNGAKLIFQAFTEGAKWYFNTFIDGIMIGINKIKEGWYELKNALGIGDETENNAVLEQIRADTERREKEIVDGAKKVKDLTVQAGQEFILAGSSLKWNSDKSLSDISGGIKKQLGMSDAPTQITPATVPGMGEIGTGGNAGTDGGAGNKLAKTNEAIATGGQRNVTNNFTIKNIVEALNISGRDFKEAVRNMEQEVADALLRVTAMAATTAG